MGLFELTTLAAALWLERCDTEMKKKGTFAGFFFVRLFVLI
jgi:hypothetical protein